MGHGNTSTTTRTNLADVFAATSSSTEPMMGRTNPPRLSGEEPLHKVRAD
jgi:hypothetical protein